MFLFLTIGIPVITYFIKAFTPAAASVASILLMTIGFASTESLYLIVIAFCAIVLLEKITGKKVKEKYLYLFYFVITWQIYEINAK